MAEIPDELARQLAAVLLATADGDQADNPVVVAEAPEPATPAQIDAAADAAVDVIEAETEREVAVIEASADADVLRETARAEAAVEVAEAVSPEAAADAQPAGDVGLSDVPPRSDHWYTRPLLGGRR